MEDNIPTSRKIALPGIGNVWQITLKDTALISVTGLLKLCDSRGCWAA